jgi:hypothetical protein
MRMRVSRLWTAGLLVSAPGAAVLALGAVAGAAPLGETAAAGRGAPVAFVELEAERGRTNGVRIGPSRTFGTLAAEASGRRAVRLPRAGAWVELTLPAAANALDVRYSIADGRTSKLLVQVGGKTIATLPLTAAYSWYYGGFPFTNRPADRGAHHFYDDTRGLLGRTLPAGTELRLVATSPTVVDLADVENVAAPLARPAGSLSVADYGGDPSGTKDSSSAFQKAIAAGEAQHRPVWIPEGTFTVNGHLLVDGVTLQGAGPWYSVLHGLGVGVYGSYAPHPSGDVHLSDFAIFGEVKERNDAAQVNGVGGALADSTISNLWIQHTKVGMWLDGPFDGLTVSGCRIQDVTADGINLHGGISHTVVEKTFVRNTGDDGLALWSDAAVSGPPDHDDVFRFDTVSLPLLANGIALYGGTDDQVTDSVVSDTLVEGGGIHLGTRFSATPFAGTTTIARNTILRAGSFSTSTQSPLGALWFWAQELPIDAPVVVRDTTIRDATYAAVQFYGTTLTKLRLDGVRLDHAGTFGLQIQANGALAATGTTARRIGRQGTYIGPTANHFAVAGTIAGLRGRYCGPFPKPR